MTSVPWQHGQTTSNSVFSFATARPPSNDYDTGRTRARAAGPRLQMTPPPEAARRTARETADIRVATYNIHRGRGMDRRVRIERIAAVLATIDPDIVALQEVIGPGLTGVGQAETLGAALGMGWVMAATRELRKHQFGNVILSRHPIKEH